MGESLLLTAVHVRVTFVPLRAIVFSGCIFICGLRKSSKRKKMGQEPSHLFIFASTDFETNNVKLLVLFIKRHIKIHRDYRARIQLLFVERCGK